MNPQGPRPDVAGKTSQPTPLHREPTAKPPSGGGRPGLIFGDNQRMWMWFALILAMFPGACFAQEQIVPTRRILPDDVVQDSIQLVQFSTNSFVVRFTYTTTGARKTLAFREMHEGQKVRTVVGSFQSPPAEMMFRPMPPAFTNYAQWKEGWLKRPRDKFFGVSEADARKIAAGLRKQ